jgi:hypothetical protein
VAYRSLNVPAAGNRLPGALGFTNLVQVPQIIGEIPGADQ